MREQARGIDWGRFQAVLFDLDGVLTQTVELHRAAWKAMFDELLEKWALERGQEFRPFTEEDYRLYVDGKPRYDGVRDFLASRSVRLPEGDPDDPPGRETVCGLGNRKNQLVNEAIRRGGVKVFDGSLRWVDDVRGRGLKTAVVSSSKNCLAVLQAAGIESRFDVRVDGKVAAELGLSGKPAPDAFLLAAKRLDVPPERAVVVEDAISGVQAGRRGGFGLVIGVARAVEPDVLRQNGADLVVGDLSELLPTGG